MSEPVTNEIVEVFTKIKKAMSEESPTDKQKRDDNSISTLNGYPGFDSLREYVQMMIKRLETMQGMIEPTDSVEVIGFRFLACQLAAQQLKAVIELPYGISEVQKRQTGSEGEV
jgi:hypothetical protein